ncbi:bleomycin resistance protein [Rosenbergiella collisarenosi]|uniref:bleomycin resistance protein n=1 Tax=Rosenbergiella collisarenosi TaxID=1544695 RepID=UPI001F4DC4CF|nr:VOC family protein [Rosenbergiella collisarenosi]
MTLSNDVYWNRMVPELSVTDFSVSLNFYTQILGFSIMVRRRDPDFAYINLGEAQLMLEQYSSDAWNTAELIKPFGRGVNFQIDVDDIDVIYRRVKRYDATLYRELKDSHYDIGNHIACQREFLLQDPDGYLLRFSQYIE